MKAPVLLLAFAVASAAHAECAQHSFDAPQLSAWPGTVVGRADFDGDGQIDIVTSSSEIHFGGSTRVVALPRAGARFVTDVDRDGRPDLVGFSGTEIFSLINVGDAAFTLKTTTVPRSSETTPGAYAGDFNGDGLLDVLITGIVDPILQSTPVFLAVGDGTFRSEYGVSIPSGANFVIADVDRDGRDDVIVNKFRTKTAFYLHHENGFAPPQLGPQIDGTVVAAADFDHDGRGDLVFYSSVPDATVTTIVFDPMGAARMVTNIAGSAVLSRDFNGDGFPDLLVFFKGQQVLLNDGHGNFNPADFLPGEIDVSGAADMDGDGVIDLLTPSGVIHGNGDGTFRVPRMAFPAASSGVAGDFDGDGDDDVALPNAVAWNNGDNTFRIAPHNDARLQRPMRAADIDGDGKAELVTIISGAVLVLALKPDGTIIERGVIGARAIDVAVGDFTGKHHPELVLLPDTLHNVEIYDIQTGAPRTVGHTEGEAKSVAVADLNGDGKDDVVVVGRIIVPRNPSFEVDGYVSTFISTAAGLQGERRNIVLSNNQQLEKVVTGDFDGDGKMDAAASTSRFENLLFFFRGDGSGDLRSVKSYPAGNPDELNRYLQTADLDGDGRTDILMNGVNGIFYGTPAGLERRAAYFSPRSLGAITYWPLLVRARRGELPWIVTPTKYADVAYVYRPLCERARPRAVRH